jgi:hypothetical protein
VPENLNYGLLAAEWQAAETGGLVSQGWPNL